MNAPGETPPVLSADELRALFAPDALLERAWALEPFMRWSERTAALDRLGDLIDEGALPTPPPGRDWRLELQAERAVDSSTMRRVEEALALVDQVVAESDGSHQLAIGRAQLAAGQALAWTGTEAGLERADRAFAEAAERFAAIGRNEWQGSALLRRGYSVWFQSGRDLVRAKALMGEAIATYAPGSRRHAGALAYYADVLINLGELDDAERILDEARTLAERDGVAKALGELSWTQAHVAAGRGDARATERLLREAEREASGFEWFETHIGTSLLLDGAELLDRVGLSEQAHEYFERGRARAGDDNEEVMQTRATLLARSGDPLQALDALQQLVRGEWLEKRRVWRHLLLTAWATFRAGRSGAGELAARALDQAIASGSLQIAVIGEADLTPALAPLAERTGSAPARRLLLGERELVVRLFGTPRMTRADGSPITLPPGMPGELARMLALHEHGLAVDVVLETFFPGVRPATGRQRLRQVLARLRAGAGDLVVREGDDHLRLIPAWVDAREFLATAARIRGASGPRAVQIAYAALALHDGPLLPTDSYAPWADEARGEVEYRYLGALDLVAADAAARGSRQEALTALEAAARHDPGDPVRAALIAEQLQKLGRERSARYVADRTERPGA